MNNETVGAVRSARKRFMLEHIDEDDFKAIKEECKSSRNILEAKLADLPGKGESLKTIEGLLDTVKSTSTSDRITKMQITPKSAM